MADMDFKFNFKFKLHKTSIPIGVADDDYARLSIMYGVSLEEMMAEVEQDRASNADEAKLLMEKFPEASAKLHGKRIAFMGDSITSDQRSYMNVMRSAFSQDTSIQILDAAISGFKTTDLMTNFVPGVTGFKPDIVHIMIGTNDMKRTTDAAGEILIPAEEYKRELKYLVRRLKAEGARVVLSTLPPYDAQKVYAAFNDANVCYRKEDRDTYNAAVREVAGEYGCLLNEMEAVYQQHDPCAITENDGLHLNCEGQRMLAQGVLEKILEAAQ